MDALSMHQAGIDFAVASLGTALTPSQAMMIRKYTEEVIIAFDADAAGQSAALRSLEILSTRGLKVTVLIVPDGKDPDEFIRRHGSERFHALIEQSIPLMDFKLLVAQKAHMSDDVLNILDYQNAACSVLAAEENAVVRELYAAKVAATLKTSIESVLSEVERRRQNPAVGAKTDLLRDRLAAVENPKDAADQSTDFLTRDELYLLSLLSSEPEVFDALKPIPQAMHFSDGAPRRVAELTLPLVITRTITPAKLIDLAADLSIRGHSMQELLARAAIGIVLPETRSARIEAAREFWTRHLLQRQRLARNELLQQLEQENDPEKRKSLKCELLLMENEIGKRG
jgi:DNA primase